MRLAVQMSTHFVGFLQLRFASPSLSLSLSSPSPLQLDTLFGREASGLGFHEVARSALWLIKGIVVQCCRCACLPGSPSPLQAAPDFAMLPWADGLEEMQAEPDDTEMLEVLLHLLVHSTPRSLPELHQIIAETEVQLEMLEFQYVRKFFLASRREAEDASSLVARAVFHHLIRVCLGESLRLAWVHCSLPDLEIVIRCLESYWASLQDQFDWLCLQTELSQWQDRVLSGG